ncbi:MAG: degradative hydroxymethylglutaryl-CoA reductase [Candidatus Marinamargulisbacteria bacterium]|jgi:degradative hydroxymethylglutaryl-CoA reductase
MNLGKGLLDAVGRGSRRFFTVVPRARAVSLPARSLDAMRKQVSLNHLHLRPFSTGTGQFVQPGIMSSIVQKNRSRVAAQTGLIPDRLEAVSFSNALQPKDADYFIENAVGVSAETYSVIQLTLNGKTTPIASATPFGQLSLGDMAIDWVQASGGISAHASPDSVMLAQIDLCPPKDGDRSVAILRQFLADREPEIIDHVNRVITEGTASAKGSKLVSRGGGMQPGIELKILSDDMAVVYMKMDVQKAMGANLVNTGVEAMSGFLREHTNWAPRTSILSNLCIHRNTSAAIKLDPEAMPTGLSVEAIQAVFDAATPGSGAAMRLNHALMKGVNVSTIASGNDWRATASGAETFASLGDAYHSLSTCEQGTDGLLRISVDTLPLALGTVGRPTKNPAASLTLEMVDPSLTLHPSRLSEIVLANGMVTLTDFVMSEALRTSVPDTPTLERSQNLGVQSQRVTTSMKGLSMDDRHLLLSEISPLVEQDFSSVSGMDLGQVALDSAPHVFGVMGLPMGFVPNVVVNGKVFHAPMIVEEPSVIAAASYGAKLIGACGGLQVNVVDTGDGFAKVLIRGELRPDVLKRRNWSGERIIQGVARMTDFADDPFRAATDKKGYMNGLDPLAFALGCDFLEISSSVHAHRGMKSSGGSFIDWTESASGTLVGQGEIVIPLDALNKNASHPRAQLARRIMGNPSDTEILGVLGAVGWLSNVAARIALSTVGIQEGHMKLDRRNNDR